MANTTNERFKTVNVEGIDVTVDTVKAGSWDAFKLFRKAHEADDELAQFDVMVELMTYTTDQDEASIVEAMGGADAQYMDVVRVVSLIVSECYPKN